MTRLSTVALLAIALFVIASAYTTPERVRSSVASRSASSTPPFQAAVVDRGAFLATASSAACLAFLPRPALAKDDPSLAGTKSDPAFQACLSQCMYDCTKAKGAEQRSRAECLPECKSKCAKTKEQLMKGTPKQD